MSDQQREIEKLRQRVRELEAEGQRRAVVQREVMELIGASSEEKIIHTLRNVLNEVTLLRAVTEREEANETV